jgi:UDP-N-acetylglucosamine 3-dehydrogenase
MRFGMIGAGGMARVHASVLSRIPGVTVAAFADPQMPPAGRELAQQLGADILTTPEALLARSDIDAIVVAVPTDLHCDLVVQAARAGKHVMSEKPLARTVEQGERMLQEADKAGVKLAVGHVVRYFPEYAAAQASVARGDVGTPGVVRAARGGAFPARPGGWFGDFARSGGVVLDVMIHELDWLIWTFGSVERVYARGLLNAGIPDKDMAMAILRFRSGAIGYVEATWARPSGFFTSFEIAGSGGLLRSNNQSTSTLQFSLFPNEDGTPRRAPAGAYLEDEPYTKQMRDIVRWFKGGPEPRTSAADGLEALKIALATIESITTGKAISFGS